jgi:type II secretory pathway pseudopilin PulG
VIPRSRKLGRLGVRRRSAGLTLIEILLSLTVFAIALGAVVSGLASVRSLDRAKRERQIATEAAISKLEELRATPFDEVFARFNAPVGDDPGAGVSPGDGFAVADLQPQVGDVDGLPGAVQFPGDNTLLIENGADAAFGMPRDLDLDGALDGLDHSGDHLLLPVRVVVQWTGRAGNQQVVLVTTLTQL